VDAAEKVEPFDGGGFLVGSVELEFEYRPKRTAIVLSGGFFGLCAAVLGATAANNDRGVIINRIIELDPEGATTFYWVLTALSGGFVALAAFLAYHRLTSRQRIAFGPAALTVPASRWSRAEKEFAYRDKAHSYDPRGIDHAKFENAKNRVVAINRTRHPD